jgi:hypothetical protein
MIPRCPCGHPAEAHGRVPGVTYSTPLVVNDLLVTGSPDTWVCVRCGCLLHHDPRGDEA